MSQLTDAELDLLRGKTDNPSTLKALVELDRKREWVAKLAPLIPDTRVWPIVAAIVDTGMAYLENCCYISADLMGCRPQYFEPSAKDRHRGRVFGTYEKCYRIGAMERYPSGTIRTHTNHMSGVVMSPAGWELAQPLVQAALDGLGAAFEAGSLSGLVCSRGRHHWERVWSLNGVSLPEFDSMVGDFPGVEHSDLRDLPMQWRLIRTEGWRIGRAGFPIRPDDDPLHVSWDTLRERIHAAAPDVVERWHIRHRW